MAFGKKSSATDTVVINPPKYEIVRVPICGTANYVMNKFSDEACRMMKEVQERGSQDRPARKKKAPKNFEEGYRGSMHVAVDGWHGIPCIAIRAAMVRACSLVGIEMTKAKMCLSVEPDGFDRDGDGLVRITKGEPEQFEKPVRNDNGSADIRSRARFAPGWEATITLKFDAEFLSKSSVVNLLERAGVQVGVGAGRPFSTKSVGQNWGTFRVVADEERGQKAAE